MNHPAKIEVGRRIRHHGAFWNDQEGLIVAIQGEPGKNRDQVIGPMTVIRPGACTFDVITFDGVMHRQCRESCIGRPGIGRIDLLDRVHGPAMIERAYRLVDEKKAADEVAAVLEREGFRNAEAARVIVDPPLFYWNGIKDAKGEKIQRAWYSPSSCRDEDEGITIYARDYDQVQREGSRLLRGAQRHRHHDGLLRQRQDPRAAGAPALRPGESRDGRAERAPGKARRQEERPVIEAIRNYTRLRLVAALAAALALYGVMSP